MAVTELTSPSEPVFAYMPVVWSASSNNVDLVRMKCDVYRGDEYGLTNVVATIYQDYDIDSTTFTFDISSICKDNLNHNLVTLDTSCVMVEDNEGHGWFKLEFTEIIETSSGLLEEAYGLFSSVRDVYNATGNHKNFIDFDVNDYIANYSQTDLGTYLTSYPKGRSIDASTNPTTYKEIGLDENEFLAYAIIPDSTSGVPVDDICIYCYLFDSNNSIINYIPLSTFQSSIKTGAGAYTKNCNYIPCGTANLVASGVSLTNAKYYTISTYNTTNNKKTTEIFRFKIVDRCDDSIRLHWQNKYGKTDSYTFEGRNTYQRSTKSNLAKGVLGNGFVSSDKGNYSFNTQTQEVYEVWTKAIGRDELAWLSEMIINNRAYVEIEKKYYAITIEDSEVLLTDTHDAPVQYKITFTMSNNIEGLRA